MGSLDVFDPSEVRINDDMSLDGGADTDATQPGVQSRHVSMGVAELKLKGEDRHDIRTVDVHGETIWLGVVADGHGGRDIACHCTKTLLVLLLDLLDEPPSGRAIRRASERAFLLLHDQALEMKHTTAGTTLTLVAVNPQREELTISHCGDSVARLVPSRSPARGLCEDHRLDSSTEERARISKLGGTIARAMDRYGRPSGPLRLWPGGVAQARAVGDRDVGHFIDARPYTSTVRLPASESCSIVVCSDGVWDALLPSAVNALTRQSMSNPAELSANLIVQSALTQRHAYSNEGDRLPKDDTTCIVIRVEDMDDPLKSSRTRARSCGCM